MIVGSICKAIPAYLPHELLGYPTDSLEGMLLTKEILILLNQKESEAIDESSKPQNVKQRSRISKFRKNK